MSRKLMFLYTGMTRNADNILSEQKANISSRVDTLNYMKHQADEMYSVLTMQDFTEYFGLMLHDGWLHKQKLAAKISDSQISEYYQKAIEAGAVGGKLLGAGGGVFLLFYCDEWKQQVVEDELGIRRVDFRFTPNGSRVIFSD